MLFDVEAENKADVPPVGQYELDALKPRLKGNFKVTLDRINFTEEARFRSELTPHAYSVKEVSCLYLINPSQNLVTKRS